MEEFRSILHSDQPSFFEIIADLEEDDYNVENNTDRRISDKIITELIAKKNLTRQIHNKNGFEGKKIINQIKTSSESFYNLIPKKKIEHDNKIFDIFTLYNHY